MIRTLSFLFVVTLAASPTLADDAPTLPLWEIGVGATARTGPDYPGASEYNATVTPFPFLTYRGRIVQFGGEQTLRVVPFRFDRFEVGLSIDGSSAVDSRDNALRGALPDLDTLAEFGPEFRFRLVDTPALIGSGNGRIELTTQIRGVFSVGSSIDRVGSLIRPALQYRQNGVLKPGARVIASIGPVFASDGVQDFFYATPDFDARGGYLSTEAALSFRYPLTDRTRVIAGVGLSLLSGAANTESPLFDEEVNGSAFLGLTYSLFQSTRRTTRDR